MATDGLLTAQNARIQNLEAGLITQGQGLLNLEATQAEILEQLKSVNIALQTLNVNLENTDQILSGVPDDFEFNVTPEIYMGVAGAAAGPGTSNTNTYADVAMTSHKQHFHFRINSNIAYTGTSGASGKGATTLAGLWIDCNYRCRIKVYSSFTIAAKSTFSLDELEIMRKYLAFSIGMGAATSEGGVVEWNIRRNEMPPNSAALYPLNAGRTKASASCYAEVETADKQKRNYLRVHSPSFKVLNLYAPGLSEKIDQPGIEGIQLDFVIMAVYGKVPK